MIKTITWFEGNTPPKRGFYPIIYKSDCGDFFYKGCAFFYGIDDLCMWDIPFNDEDIKYWAEFETPVPVKES